MDEWMTLLKAFETDQESIGLSASTVGVMARRLTRLPEHVGAAPLHALTARVRAYVDGLAAGKNPSTAKAQAGAVRAFYRWAVETGRRASDPLTDYVTVVAKSSTQEIGPAWVTALEEWSADQRARGVAASTIDQRVKYLRRLARFAGGNPWELPQARINMWLESLSVAPASVLAHRSAARVFYRWAGTTGRSLWDPTLIQNHGPDPRAVPPAWLDPLQGFTSHLRAGGRAETTVTTFLDVLRHFARQNSHLGPFEVATEDVTRWMGNKRWARETRRRNRQTLMSFYRWAEERGHVMTNPVNGVPIIRAEQAHARPAEQHEYATALLRAEPSEALALRLAAEMGMRRAEVSRVHTTHVEGTHGMRTLVVVGKGGKVRRLPILDGLAAQILDRPAGYVFPGADQGHVSPRWMGKRITRLLPDGVTMHQLRHKFATEAYAIDRDLFGVQQLLGHASPATTRGYVRLQPESLRRLVAGVAS